MQKLIVTGYIPIQGHPRTAQEYGELGENLFGKLEGDFAVHPFYETVGETWLAKSVKALPFDVTHSAGDNPAKNTIAYHCVQHQKLAWLLKALMLHKEPQVFVWLDYGAGHVPGVTPDVVNEFMAKVKEDDFAIPGCWTREGLLINDFFPCWRFCGTLMIVPRDLVYRTYKVFKEATMKYINKSRNVSWEVNDWARAEKDWRPAPRWYSADHNETMFTNYGAPDADPPV